VAVLARTSGAAIDEARSAFERWLSTERGEARACAARSHVTARPGIVEIRDAATEDFVHALVGVSLPAPPEGGLSREAVWTSLLLRRPGGWLDRALASTGLASGAGVRLLGGGNAAALVVGVVSPRDPALAIDQVRALFARLAAGAATHDDATYALDNEERASRTARLDPRFRIVQQFAGRVARRAPDLTSLRRFHAEAFAAERHVVVLTRVPPGAAGEKPSGPSAPTPGPRATRPR
jgi:hypothetical protein